MGVNRPSVEASGLTTTGKFMPHATSPEKKRQERSVEGGRHDRDRKRENQKNSGKYRVSDEQRRRRVTFVLDF
jgi:hypothetical protein